MNTNVLGVPSWISDKVHELYTAPGWMLVIPLCIITGYVLRVIKRFPNDGIPLVVVMMGIIMNALLAPPRPTDTSMLQWRVKTLVVGAILGFLAWVFHRVILRRLEDRFPWLKGVLAESGLEPETPTDNKPLPPTVPKP